ncbi:MAG: hypothetical protein AAGF44_06545 [Pseudomonadota bacterium]
MIMAQKPMKNRSIPFPFRKISTHTLTAASRAPQQTHLARTPRKAWSHLPNDCFSGLAAPGEIGQV